MTQQISERETKGFSILLVGTQMAIGGAQRGLLDQARWLKSHGCEVVVAFFYDKEGFYEKWSQSVDFPVYNFQAHQRGAGFLRQGILLLRGLWRLWALLRRERFDVVETFTHDSNILGLPLAWFARVPVRIATHRGKIEAFSKWRRADARRGGRRLCRTRDGDRSRNRRRIGAVGRQSAGTCLHASRLARHAGQPARELFPGPQPAGAESVQRQGVARTACRAQVQSIWRRDCCRI